MSDKMSLGDEAQTRLILEQIGKAAAAAAIVQLRSEHPEVFAPKAEVPPPLKWAGGIIAALLVLAAGGTMQWLIATTNTTQLTVGRIEERINAISETQASDVADLKRRVDRLEDAEGKR